MSMQDWAALTPQGKEREGGREEEGWEGGREEGCVGHSEFKSGVSPPLSCGL